MEQHWNTRYQKLKIKRKVKERLQKEKRPKKLISAAINDNLFDDKYTVNDKIDRFMRDVKKYGRSSTGDESDLIGDNLHRNEISGKLKIQEEGNEKHNVLSLKEKKHTKDKSWNCVNKSNINRREGLFQRGIMSKSYNKGLMPPSLSARLNEDLKKMIKLATGKQHSSKSSTKSRSCFRNKDEMWKRITTLKSKRNDFVSDQEEEEENGVLNEQINNSLFDDNNDEIINSDDNRLPRVPQKVEAEVQVSGPVQDDSRTCEDLYLKFTHFVTRSLHTSGVIKDGMKSYSDSVKESLVQIYHNRLKEQDQGSGPCSVEQNSDDISDIQENVNNIECSRISPLSCTGICNCSSISKSDEGPSHVKNLFHNENQLSDDLIIRNPELYYSGINYLKAVFGCNGENNNCKIKNSETNELFSPNQKYNCDVNYQESVNSLYRDECSSVCSQVNFNSNHNDNDYELSKHYFSPNKRKVCDNLNKSGEFNNNFTLQYFPGYLKKKCTWNDKQCSHCYSNSKNQTVPISNQMDIRNSPEYISLLPSISKSSENYSNNLYGTQPAENISFKGSGDCLQAHQSILSIPKHLPPRKSPDILFLPRKMF